MAVSFENQKLTWFSTMPVNFSLLFYMFTKMNYVWRLLNMAGMGVKNWNKM